VSDTPDNIFLQHLRLIREDLSDIKGRLTALDAGQAMLIQHIAHLATSSAQQQVSFDRLTERVERIERRLELVS